MTKSNFYKYALFFLIALNIGLLSFVIISKPQPPRPPFNGPMGPDSFLDQAFSVLQLDKQQKDLFSDLARVHKEDMDRINKKEKTLISEYFESINEKSSETHSESLLVLINDVNTEKITVTFKHFEDIKALLRPDQKPNFEKFMERALNNILGDNKKDLPPPKGF